MYNNTIRVSNSLDPDQARFFCRLDVGSNCYQQTTKSSRVKVWVRCTINRSHSTPCKKAEFEHLQIFPGHCLDFFLPVSGKICHSPIKKSEKTAYLDNLVFSAFSVLWGTVKKSGLKSDQRQTLPGECAGESVTK